MSKCYSMYKNSTQIPNVLLDYHLRTLTNAELKILQVIMRQTHGWVDKRTKARKTRDMISHSQFIEKTGLSRRIITKTIPSLLRKGLIAIADQNGRLLTVGRERTGRTHMFYSSTCALSDNNLGTFRHQPGQKGSYNKTNYTKLREESVNSVEEIIARMANLKFK